MSEAKVAYKRFSDFAEEPQALEGSKLKIDDVLNRELIIKGYSLRGSKYPKNESGKCLTLQFSFADDETEQTYILFTGSEVLVRQLESYSEEIPFYATIKKVNRYYTLS